MATIKVIFRAASNGGKEGTLYYRIIHKRRVRQIHTGNRISCHEWDKESGSVIVSGPDSRQDYLRAVQDRLLKNVARLERIVSVFDHSGADYTADDVAERYLAPDAVIGFVSFMRKTIAENRRFGNVSAAEHYSAALNSFIRFLGRDEVSFDELDHQIINAYERHLKGLGLCPNTTSYYMRKLRAVYNMAVELNLTPQRNPFKHVYTGVARTAKRSVSLDVVKSLRGMDLRLSPMAALARDMFLFSFYTRGMSMVDMAYLKKRDLQNGILNYRRQKTRQQLSIRWEKPMREIVNRHEITDSEFLLPLIKSSHGDARRQYLNASHVINRHLKQLGQTLGLAGPLTMYVARHTWASIARDNNVPISVISQGMGHDSEKTTRIYLASLDTSVLDKANKDIISLLDR